MLSPSVLCNYDLQVRYWANTLKNETFGQFFEALYQRNRLLDNPSIACAAVVQGGIVWRLGVDKADMQDIFAGSSIEDGQPSLVLACVNSSRFYMANTLMEHELHVLCGVYSVGTLAAQSSMLTANTALLSW